MNRKVFKRILSLLIVAAMLAGIMPSNMKADVAVAADSLVSAELGDRVLFGQYYQESEEYKSPIEWSVVETSEVYTSSDGEKVQDLTLFSVNALDYKVNYTWELDEEFYDSSEGTMIINERNARFEELIRWKDYIKNGKVTKHAYESEVPDDFYWQSENRNPIPAYYIEEVYFGAFMHRYSYVGGMYQHEWSDTEGKLVYRDTYDINETDFDYLNEDIYADRSNGYSIYASDAAYLRPVIEITIPVDEIEYAYDTIYYEPNGGKINPTYDTYRKGEGKELRTPTKAGYDFVGWYYDEQLTNPVVDNKIPVDMSGDITVYAKWDVPKPDLIVTDIFWEPVNPCESDEVTFKAVIKNIGTAATPEGKILGVRFSVGTLDNYYTWDDTYTSSLAPGESITLTATGGRYDGKSTWTCGPNEEYTIIAWVNDIAYPVRISEKDKTNNTYSKVLTTSPFRIDYEPNGGTVEGDAFELYRLGTERDLKVPVKEGYEFGGWYYDSELTEPVTDNKITPDMKGNFTVYAKWIEKKDYKIVEFGRYPKSEVAETEELLNAEWISKYCGAFYCKNTVDVHFATLADGTSYARIVNDEGNYQYFKCEPIEWVVIDEDENGNYSLMAKDVIDATYISYEHAPDEYCGGVNDFSWETSWCHYWMNSLPDGTCLDGFGFTGTAFSRDEVSKLNFVPTEYKNLGYYWIYDADGIRHAYTLTEDVDVDSVKDAYSPTQYWTTTTAIKLLSEDEAEALSSSLRMAEYTDFANSRFNNAHLNTEEKTYWLRGTATYNFAYNSTDIKSGNIMVVNSDTGVINRAGIHNEYYPDGTGNKSGIRPVINVNKSVFEEYRIDYEPNGGTVEGDAFELYRSGTERDLKVPVKEGYEFGGWYYDSELTEPVADNKITAEMKGDFTVYAKWIEEKYKVVEFGQYPKSEVAETEELVNAEWISKDTGYRYFINTLDIKFTVLDDGTSYARALNDNGEYQYFKFEPIEWIVTDEDEEGNYTLLSKDVIDATYITYEDNDSNVFVPEWEASYSEDWMNVYRTDGYNPDGFNFAMTAFSQEEFNKINPVWRYYFNWGYYRKEEADGLQYGYTFKDEIDFSDLEAEYKAKSLNNFSYLRVSLLSEAELKQLDTSVRAANYTDFANCRFYNAHENTTEKTYWLREVASYNFPNNYPYNSINLESTYYMVVNSDTGKIDTTGILNEYYDNGSGNKSGIRPVININKSVLGITDEEITEETIEETTEAYAEIYSTVHIEAEDYVSIDGMFTGPIEYDKSQFLADATHGNTVTYNVELPKTGNYRVALRCSAIYKGLRTAKVYIDGEYKTTVTITPTDTIENFKTFESEEISLEKGSHSVTLEIVNGGYLINWIEFAGGKNVNEDSTEEQPTEEETTAPSEDTTKPVRIEAENFVSQSGVEISSKIYDDSQFINGIGNGDSATYNVDIPENGSYTIGVRASTTYDGKRSVDVYVDGEFVTNIPVTSTGSWATFETFISEKVSLTEGVHTVTLKAVGGGYNINWFEFTPVEAVEDETEASTEASTEVSTEVSTEATTEAVDNYTVHIEAENYDSQLGVALRGVYDQGTDVLKSVEAGDWMTYTVDIPVSGTYRFDARAARADGGTSLLSLMENDSVVATVDIAATGGWGTFSEFEGTETYLEAGQHTFKVYANGGRYNLNWYELVNTAVGEPEVSYDVKFEAESYDSQSGVSLRGTYDQGTDVLSSVETGDWMAYTVEVPVSGTYRFDARAARTDGGTSLLSLMENDSVVATIDVGTIGGWGTFSEFEGTETYLEAGKHIFKVYANGGRYNLNWFKLVNIAVGEPEVSYDVKFEAESYGNQSGVSLRGTYDQGTDVLSSVGAGDWMTYTVEVPVSGTYRFDVRAARKDAGVSLLSLMENDSTVATVGIETTGGWGTFSEFEGTEVELTEGIHSFKVYADGGRYNLNWFKLVKVS